MESLIEFLNNQSKLVGTIFILVGSYVLSLICKIAIDLVFRGVQKRLDRKNSIHALAKTRTVKHLLKNVINVFFLFVAVMMILAHFGFNIVPLLTGASILGLAVSFGAQTFFKDLFAGLFIITEDQFNIGDRVKIGNVEGKVYKMTLRMTVLKDAKGNFIYISNSQIESVTRFK